MDFPKVLPFHKLYNQDLNYFNRMKKMMKANLNNYEKLMIDQKKNALTLSSKIPKELFTEKILIAWISQEYSIISNLKPENITKTIAEIVVKRGVECLKYIPENVIDENICIESLHTSIWNLRHIPKHMPVRKIILLFINEKRNKKRLISRSEFNLIEKCFPNDFELFCEINKIYPETFSWHPIFKNKKESFIKYLKIESSNLNTIVAKVQQTCKEENLKSPYDLYKKISKIDQIMNHL